MIETAGFVVFQKVCLHHCSGTKLIPVLEIKISQNCLHKLPFGSSRKWENQNFCAKPTSEQNQFKGKFQPKCIWSIIRKFPRLQFCVKQKIISSHGRNSIQRYHFDQFFQVWNLGFVLAHFCLPTIKIWHFRKKSFCLWCQVTKPTPPCERATSICYKKTFSYR